MNKIIEKIKRIWPKQKPIVKRIWYDENKGQVFIHTNCRSGLFYLPVQGGKKYSLWLADVFEIEGRKLPKTETIYRLMDIEENRPTNNTPLTSNI